MNILRSPIGSWFWSGLVRFLIPTARRGAPHWRFVNVNFGILIYGYECKFVDKKMNFEAASLSLDFENAWSRLAPDLRSQFVRSGLQLASTWAHLLPAGSSEDAARAAFGRFLPQMGLSEADGQAMGACLGLWSAACAGRDGVVHRCARLTPLQVAADKAT